jgi:hypothetical protein
MMSLLALRARQELLSDMANGRRQSGPQLDWEVGPCRCSRRLIDDNQFRLTATLLVCADAFTPIPFRRF